jgi:tRNA(adenine34) deaminase
MSLSVYTPEYFMREALKQAQRAMDDGDVPIGAVVECGGRIIAKAYNQVEKLNDATAHAEMLAITAAGEYLGAKYLTDCTLYVTLEPCTMCAGAMFWSQLHALHFALSDQKRGYTTKNAQLLHPKTKVSAGLMSEESLALLNTFFHRLRDDHH